MFMFCPRKIRYRIRILGLRGPAWDTAKRIPGRSAGEPMNSMPAASKAALTSSRVEERLGGTSSAASNLLIVWIPTLAFLDKVSADQRRAALAARI
jgi:hypothetical protein